MTEKADTPKSEYDKHKAAVSELMEWGRNLMVANTAQAEEIARLTEQLSRLQGDAQIVGGKEAPSPFTSGMSGYIRVKPPDKPKPEAPAAAEHCVGDTGCISDLIYDGPSCTLCGATMVLKCLSCGSTPAPVNVPEAQVRQDSKTVLVSGFYRTMKLAERRLAECRKGYHQHMTDEEVADFASTFHAEQLAVNVPQQGVSGDSLSTQRKK